MDLRTRRVERDGHEVQLTAREFELLAYLMRHPDQVLSREQILNAVWGFDFDPGTKVLEVYVGYLRRKLVPTTTAPTRSRRSATSATGCASHVSSRPLPGGLRAAARGGDRARHRGRGRRQLPGPLQRDGSRLQAQVDSELKTQAGGMAPVAATADSRRPPR